MISTDRTMDIHTPPGATVVYAFPNNGWKGDQDIAAKYLEEGAEYTVNYIEIESWHSSVILTAFPGIMFNTVMFRNVVEGE